MSMAFRNLITFNEKNGLIYGLQNTQSTEASRDLKYPSMETTFKELLLQFLLLDLKEKKDAKTRHLPLRFLLGAGGFEAFVGYQIQFNHKSFKGLGINGKRKYLV